MLSMICSWLIGATIAAYSHAAEGLQHDPTRDRKLLAHRRQLRQLGSDDRGNGTVVFRAVDSKDATGAPQGRGHSGDRLSVVSEDDDVHISQLGGAAKRPGGRHAKRIPVVFGEQKDPGHYSTPLSFSAATRSATESTFVPPVLAGGG